MNDTRQNKPVRILEADLLMAAYAAGYFPMAESSTGEISWYSPDPRAIIPLDAFTVPRSLRQTIKKDVFTVRIDISFEEVIRSCAGREETWISAEIVQSYRNLHRLGHAHSVECWRGDRLVGGLYGVALKGAFFGESMFSREKDASKVALAWLVRRLNDRRFMLLDTQFLTPHLSQFGTIELPRAEYLRRLKQALSVECSFG